MTSKSANSIPEDVSEYDRAKDETKTLNERETGIKGLVDAGVTKIPSSFVHPREDVQTNNSFQVPIIDLEGFESCGRLEVVEKIRKAAEEWSVFHIVNHGIPDSVMDEMLSGVRQFHEQPSEVKMELHPQDPEQLVQFYGGNIHQNKAAGLWRDSISFRFLDLKLDPTLIPDILRKEVSEYMRHIEKTQKKLCGLLSEALGLGSDYLSSIECMETALLTCHYYPACPEPDLAIGHTKHSDVCFLTILMQDFGGLQVLHQNQWVDVSPLHGALVVIIGDMIQLISNDRFVGAVHRALVQQAGPRISVPCFFYPSTACKCKPYGPIKELLGDNPPIYREAQYLELVSVFLSKVRDGGGPILPHFKL